MIIENEKYVGIDYTLIDQNGEVMDSTEGKQPLGYVQGTQTLLIGLEESLEGKKTGDEFEVKLESEKAYGEIREDMIFEVSKSELGEIKELEKGMRLQANTPDGVRTFTVKEVNDETVLVDGNHPLAGESLHFKVKVTEVRDATEEELSPQEHCGCGCDHSEKKGHEHGHCGNHEHGHKHGNEAHQCNCN